MRNCKLGILIDLIKTKKARIKYINNSLFYKKKLNSNSNHYEPKFILTSKQKYNSKFQEFETVRTHKIQETTEFGPKKFPRINDYEKPTKK